MFMPVRVIDVKRALSLLVTGAAEVVDVEPKGWNTYDFAGWAELSALKAEFERDQHAWVGLVRGPMAAPSVVRLMRFDRHRRQRIPLNRRNIYFRDGNICQYCGKKFPTSELSLDHIIPRSRGGGETWDNLVCACTNCNGRKADRTPLEAKMRLIRAPKPVKSPAQLIRVQNPTWAAFVDEAYWNVELK
jgi:5-methylcytosine-specific restriction endonuclease McrA